jgi:hypothetical protein
MDIVSDDPLVDTSTSDTTSTENTDSLAEHESEFNQPGRAGDGPLNVDEPDEIPKTPANTGQFANKREDARHRASTQRATPEDVAEINKLTKELRELETKVADRDPDAKSAPRLRTLKRQIAALRALDAPTPVEPKPTATAKREPVTAEFSDKEPVYEDFSADPVKYPDPLAAWMKATARYETRKDRWEEQQAQASQSRQEKDQQELNAWHAHQSAFIASKPDYPQVVGEFYQRDIGPVLVKALTASGDKGPSFVYYLAQHPELADELIVLTHGKPVEDAFVAYVQRRLNKELQGLAAPTRSVTPPARPYTPPPPPNLVRTGPIKSEDELPGDDASLVEHERAFNQRRHR